MSISPTVGLSPPVTTPMGMDPRAHAKASPKDAAHAFESMFTSLLIKHMRQPLEKEHGLFGHDPSDVMGGLFDHFMGQHIAQKGGLGIGKMIEKHLQTAQAAGS